MSPREIALRSIDVPSIHKFAVGFDSMFDEILRQTSIHQNGNNYPPYNVVKHTEDTFSIELAVAGFKEGDITIEVEQNQLTVKGEQAIEVSEGVEYLYKGISTRSFSRTWTLADYVKTTGAEVKNGILSVHLHRVIPEEQKPKKIAITFTK